MTVSNKIRTLMRAKGYVPSVLVAETAGYSPSAIRRWINEGKVGGMVAGGEQFVLYTDLVKHIGDAAEALGIFKLDPYLPQEPDPTKAL